MFFPHGHYFTHEARKKAEEKAEKEAEARKAAEAELCRLRAEMEALRKGRVQSTKIEKNWAKRLRVLA